MQVGLAARVPGATAHVLPGHGHLFAEHLPAILRELAAA